MKVSEFRKLIREEVRRVLNEEEKLDTRGMNPTSARAYKQKDYIAIDKNTKLKVGDSLLGIGNGMFASIVKIKGDKIAIQYDADSADDRPIVRDIKKMPERFLIQNPNKEDGYADKRAAAKPKIGKELDQTDTQKLGQILSLAIDPEAFPELKGQTVSGFTPRDIDGGPRVSFLAALIKWLPERYNEDIEDFEDWIAGSYQGEPYYKMVNWNKLKDPQLAASYKEFDSALKALGAVVEKLDGYQGFAQAYEKVVNAIKKFDKTKLAGVPIKDTYKFRLGLPKR